METLSPRQDSLPRMKQDFFAQRVERYRKRGYRVYGPFPGLRLAPADWIGPAPDLFVEKGERRIAKLMWTEAECRSRRAANIVRIMLRNPGVRVRLFAVSPRALRAARALRRRVPFLNGRGRVEIYSARPARSRARTTRGGVARWRVGNYLRRHRLEWGFGVAAVLTGIVILAQFHFVLPIVTDIFGTPGRDGAGYLEQIKELERRLERLGRASHLTPQGRSERSEALHPGAVRPGRPSAEEYAPASPLNLEEEFRRFRDLESRALEELRRRGGGDPAVNREVQRLREMEDRALDELRKRGITEEHLRRRGIIP
ncbi:MAG: hypothetical protein HY575_08815 [candidate division NC10 bacterium]|nr:hypothetical protein [candidate division NC10 bacterium]